MSSILHPLQTASQKWRPKHQVLIQRCYPQYQKNVQEIKPNSSELSYLLYYASTRRSKLQKVGAFLEKKMANDVYRLRLGNVQVTLQILTALIEKSPRDISLYASSVLTIIDCVLRSKDINMVEETLPTLEAYCKHVDVPALLADQNRAKQYLSIVQIYASFASSDQVVKGRAAAAVPLAIRWRNVSLKAIRAVVGSDAISVDSSTQLNSVMPVILENLSLEDGDILQSLQDKAHTSEKQSTEVARRRRLSIATVTTIDTTDANPAMASETTADADKIAEDEVRVLAVRCLKHIFSISTSSSRGQTRLATALTLRFIAAKQKPQDWSKNGSDFDNTWAAALFEAIARWTPVQDRFVIVLTAIETLVRSPIIESVLEKQLVLTNMIDYLLRSDINLIGLSVMDVLLSLVHHMLLLLQLGNRDSKALAHYQHQDILGLFTEAKETFEAGDAVIRADSSSTANKDETTASPTRKQLLRVLERCIGDLSNHIYYSDQISDMIATILAKLKPSSHAEVSSVSAAINDPVTASRSIAESASLREDPATDSFFSFATARVIALRAVRDVIITANNRRGKTGASAEARSRVGVQVWDGTQWLLKDEDAEVRFAYVDALCHWLRLETNKSDLVLPQDGVKKNNRLSKRPDMDINDGRLAKRAASNASKKESKLVRSTFYQLIHLAVYDHALDFAEQERDILLLQLLLSTMVERLGVNTIRSGLPMIMELQNTALNGAASRSPQAKANISSLVYAYLWAISNKFGLENTNIGREIDSQISKRKQNGIWLNRVQVPALDTSQIRQQATHEQHNTVSDEIVDNMKPFLDVTSLVEGIATAYDDSLLTPPNSAPSSPGRAFSVPALGFGYGFSAAATTRPAHQDQMPQKVKDEMYGSWSREACLANLARERSASLAGSRTGDSSGRKQHLSLTPLNGNASGGESPASPAEPQPIQQSHINGFSTMPRSKNGAWSGSALHLTNSSSHDSTVRVSDLKRTLSGFNIAGRNGSALRRPFTASRRSLRESEGDSESMMSWHEVDEQDSPTADGRQSRPATSSGRKEGHTYHGQATLGPEEDVPPVPKIPSTLNLPGTWPHESSPTRTKANGLHEDPLSGQHGTRRVTITSSASGPRSPTSPTTKRLSRPSSRSGAASVRSQTYTVTSTKAADVKTAIAGFLAGIEVDATNGFTEGTSDVSKKRLISPPY